MKIKFKERTSRKTWGNKKKKSITINEHVRMTHQNKEYGNVAIY